ncbi:hypothetical protein [Paraburkholderia caffeinilytica]|uniref:hypothetical protein n=1 Tax=Paraburkholderia caffeinilytica TaxID=1761016 RepID=UPI0013BE8E1E|nr:hypothetical protein [Paraburkholderia caffeinilytica]
MKVNSASRDVAIMPTSCASLPAGSYDNFAVIEMDDAVIAQVCLQQGLQFTFVRNVSDTAQNASLPAEVQGDWGSAVYDVFGFYTSYNGALTARAIIAALSV